MQTSPTAATALPWGVAFALLLTLLVNFLANALPIAGRTTGQISDSLPTLLTPPGYVFSIWALIYLGMAFYTVIQLLPNQQGNPTLRRIAPWFMVSSLFNVAWILAWHYGALGLSVLLMLGLLLCLVAIYRRLSPSADGDWWIVRWSFSLYLGWILVATIVNISAALVGWGWNGAGLPAEVWAVGLIAVAAGLGVAFLRLNADVTIPLVLIWALVGIAVQQWGNPAMVVAALVAVGFLGYSILARRQIRLGQRVSRAT